jgi:hypothetical protein
MSEIYTPKALQDAVNLLEVVRKKCFDAKGWTYLVRAQRYLIDPEGYKTEVEKRNCRSPELGQNSFQSNYR